MNKIDIRPEKVKSTKYKLNPSNYENLKNDLFVKLESDGYGNFSVYEGAFYNIDYAIKSKYTKSYIVAMMELPELTEEIYVKYKDNYFEDFGNYLLESNQVKKQGDINLICIICVEKGNSIFTKYTEGNVKQYFGRYVLPVGVSFASKTLYIATQKEGIAITKYKSLRRLLLTYFSDLIKRES